MKLKYKVCKTEKGYLTHHYFLVEGNLDNFFNKDIDSAWMFLEGDSIDVDLMCDRTGVKEVEFVEVSN